MGYKYAIFGDCDHELAGRAVLPPDDYKIDLGDGRKLSVTRWNPSCVMGQSVKVEISAVVTFEEEE